jgi:hypothetical protein
VAGGRRGHRVVRRRWRGRRPGRFEAELVVSRLVVSRLVLYWLVVSRLVLAWLVVAWLSWLLGADRRLHALPQFIR